MTKRGHNYEGLYVTFEGPDGSGKSTQFAKFNYWLKEQGYKVTEVREPGGTKIGEQIREILLNTKNEEMDLITEFLLFESSRAQLIGQRIIPALLRGEIVSGDRGYDSTLAYQGAAGTLPIDMIMDGNKIATQGISTDRTYILDVPLEVSAQRLNPKRDRMEEKGRTYHERLRNGFLEIANLEPDRIKVINTETATPDEIHELIIDDFRKYLEEHRLVGKLKMKEE